MFKILRFYAGFGAWVLRGVLPYYAELRKNKDQIKTNKDQAFYGNQEAGKILSSCKHSRIPVGTCESVNILPYLCRPKPLVHKYRWPQNWGQ